MWSRARTGSSEAVTSGILAAAAAGILVVAYVPQVTDRFVTDEVNCPVRLATGWKCPFCGMTHGMVALLHGHLDAVMHQNAFAPVFVIGLVVLLLVSFGARRPPWLPKPSSVVRHSLVGVLAGSFTAYAVLRNVLA